MKKHLLLFLAAVLLHSVTCAQRRTEAAAISEARAFWDVEREPLKVVPQKQISKAKVRVASGTSDAAQPAYYVVNDETGGRFVIVGADERLHTILGYSDNGIFDAEKAPAGLIGMMLEYDAQYQALAASPGELKAGTTTRGAVAPVAPLLKSKWNQMAPYNGECPVDITFLDNWKCPSGCVATAMAQVMYYYKYPECGQGANSYISSTKHIYQSMDFSAVRPDWNNMTDEYGTGASTPEQNAAVAELMHAAGVSVSMDYSAFESGASPYDIAYALSSFWKYSPSVSFRMKQYYSDEEWNRIIRSELSEGHPVLYGGTGNQGGHRFVLDGCDADGLYHFNFGWSGSCDGYYSLSAIYIEDEDYDFTSSQSMVCNIRPSQAGTPQSEFYTTGSMELTTAEVGNSFFKYICCDIYNYSSVSALKISLAPKFEGKVGVGLFDKDFTFVKSLVEGNVALKNAYGVRLNSTIGFDAATFFDGASYYVALYAYSPETGYSIVRTEKGLEDYYLATVKDGTVTFEPMKKMGDETPVVGEVVTGLYNGRATNGEGKALTWQVNVWKDGQESGKYWIANLDPMVRNKGFSYDKGWNKVYGYASANGSKIDIPVDQTVGTNLRLRNYSGGDNITLYLSAKEKKMSIDDVWGAVELDNGAENATVSEFSRYSGTSFEFTTVSEDGGEQNVLNPVISVSEEHLLTISCSAPEAAIYYTLDGTRPSVGGTRYVSPLTLTENGIVKAIAVKDGLSSEVVTYEVTDFVCATPQISQAGKSNKVDISCATPGVRICYTLDNSIPTAASATYTGEFEITKSCIVKAIAIRNNYNQSAIASRSVIYYQAETPQPGSGEVIVEGNVAGGLANRVSEADISSATRWIISGELNGTDFKLLRQVMKNGRITDLDLGNAIIVSGGEPYYSNYGTEYSTENNVVGPNMFYKAHSLISLRLPSTTRAIGRYALQGCDNLASISIPDQCESVEGSAIWSCDHLASIHIGREVRSFEGDNGNMCPALAEITVDERNEYFRTVGGVLFNKDMTRLHKYPVARAGSEYVVPDPVKAIGEDAFYGAQLEGISLPGTLTEIQSNAFSKCSHLKAIDLPADVTVLGSFAFMNCSSLSTIDIPDGVEELGMFCFGYCANLRECRLGASVRKIESSAFTGATSLQAFSVAAINTSFTASKGILYSKDMSRLVRCPLALYSEELFVPDGVTVIESDAFASCGNIAKFVLPEGLEKIESSAFEHCSMKEINIPNSVSEIGMFAFQECNSLQSFAIPDGVKEIKLYLLYDCDELSYVYIPDGVTVIEGNAFSRSRKLATIESRIADIDKVEVEAGHDGNYSQFNNIPADCTWHVPAGCAENYKVQPWWVPTWKVMDDLSTSISSRPAEESLSLRAADGLLVITAGADAVVSIFNAAGVLAGKVEVKRGMTRSINLPAGVYIVSGQKILIK